MYKAISVSCHNNWIPWVFLTSADPHGLTTKRSQGCHVSNEDTWRLQCFFLCVVLNFPKDMWCEGLLRRNHTAYLFKLFFHGSEAVRFAIPPVDLGATEKHQASDKQDFLRSAYMPRTFGYQGYHRFGRCYYWIDIGGSIILSHGHVAIWCHLFPISHHGQTQASTSCETEIQACQLKKKNKCSSCFWEARAMLEICIFLRLVCTCQYLMFAFRLFFHFLHEHRRLQIWD